MRFILPVALCLFLPAHSDPIHNGEWSPNSSFFKLVTLMHALNSNVECPLWAVSVDLKRPKAVIQPLLGKRDIKRGPIEHATLKDLISQVKGKEPESEMFDAKIKVMSEYVKHHVKEEEDEIFPKAKKSDLDLVKMGSEIFESKSRACKCLLVANKFGYMMVNEHTAKSASIMMT